MTREERDREYGFFVNDGLEGRPCGYKAELFGYEKKHWWSASVPQWHFTLDPVRPFQMVCGKKTAACLGVPEGTEVQPSRKYDTDYGSVPSFMWWAYSPERFAPTWLIHDSAYIFGYVWVRETGSNLWHQLQVTRAQADHAWCEYGVLAQDGSRLDAALIFNAVNLFGWGVWASHGR